MAIFLLLGVSFYLEAAADIQSDTFEMSQKDIETLQKRIRFITS
jgi:hypothetical protein